jgi:hypothetical protein
MSNKKKKGLGFILSGVAFLIVGVFSIKGNVPPTLGQIFSIVGLVANALGIAFVYPDEAK